MFLEDILDSDLKTELLAFFLIASQRTYTVPEISLRMKKTDRALQPALQALVENALLKTFKKSNKIFYFLNTRSTLVQQMLSVTQRQSKKYTDELFTEIKKLGQLSGAFLSGVFTGEPKLPVDILLVGKVDLSKLDNFLTRMKKVIGVDINYSIMSWSEFNIRLGTFDRFIKDIFDYRHVVVVPPTKPKRVIVKK